MGKQLPWHENVLVEIEILVRKEMFTRTHHESVVRWCDLIENSIITEEEQSLIVQRLDDIFTRMPSRYADTRTRIRSLRQVVFRGNKSRLP